MSAPIPKRDDGGVRLVDIDLFSALTPAQAEVLADPGQRLLGCIVMEVPYEKLVDFRTKVMKKLLDQGMGHQVMALSLFGTISSAIKGETLFHVCNLCSTTGLRTQLFASARKTKDHPTFVYCKVYTT